MQFTKLFNSILDSTIWQEPAPTKILWVTMLAMSDKDGLIHASVPGLAKRAGITLDEAENGLKCFLEPDKYSRTKEFEGRRIEVIDGGWRLLNHDYYRRLLSADERREYKRKKQKEYRDRKKMSSENVDRNVDRNVDNCGKKWTVLTHTEAEAEAEVEVEVKKGTKKTKKLTPSQSIKCLPQELFSFKEIIFDWLNYKNDTFGFLYTANGLKSLFAQCRKFSVEEITQAVEVAKMSGYKGFFPKKLNESEKPISDRESKHL